MPVLIASTSRQINILIDKALATSQGYGSVSILSFANVIFLALSGLFINSLVTVLYPYIAKGALDKKDKGKSLLNSIKSVVVVTVPIFIIMLTYSTEISFILYKRGSFTEQNTMDVAGVFIFYAIGLIPYGIAEIIRRSFYSEYSYNKPMLVGLIAISINIILNYILISIIGVKGIALATSIASLISMLLLMLLKRKSLIDNIKEIRKFIAKVTFISIALVLISIFIKKSTYMLINSNNNINMLICLLLGGIVFVGI